MTFLDYLRDTVRSLEEGYGTEPRIGVALANTFHEGLMGSPTDDDLYGMPLNVHCGLRMVERTGQIIGMMRILDPATYPDLTTALRTELEIIVYG